MKKTLTLVVATLTAGAVTASAAISAITMIDQATSVTPPGAPADVDPSYHVNGWWTPLTPGDVTIKNDVFWNSVFSGSKMTVGGVDIWLMAVEANHKGVAPLVPNFAAVLGMANVVGNNGTVNSYVAHAGAPGDGDYYKFAANIAPSGQMNFDLYGKHVVPEPGSFAMIAGLGLVGFAAYRRIRA